MMIAQKLYEGIDLGKAGTVIEKKVGDEGSSLKLTLELSASGIVVDNKAIQEIGLKYLDQKIPSGYTLSDQQISSDFSFENTKDNLYNINLLVSADLKPEVNIDEIRKNITGKYPRIAEEYLNKNVPGYERAVIKFKSLHFPGKLGTLPRISKNIEITVNVDK